MSRQFFDRCCIIVVVSTYRRSYTLERIYIRRYKIPARYNKRYNKPTRFYKLLHTHYTYCARYYIYFFFLEPDRRLFGIFRNHN